MFSTSVLFFIAFNCVGMLILSLIFIPFGIELKRAADIVPGVISIEASAGNVLSCLKFPHKEEVQYQCHQIPWQVLMESCSHPQITISVLHQQLQMM